MSTRSAPFVMAIAALAYLLAVTQRSTMGIAALIATDRYQTNAEQLSILAVSQLVVYVAMQIPVGILLDRFGPRVLLALGSAAMSFGQLIVGFSDTLTIAVVGRILVGFGDAFVFISMIGLINGWYHGKRASQLQQWLGNLGQIGQVMSAIPFSILLHLSGWTSAFVTMSAIGIFVACCVALLVRDDSGEHAEKHKASSLKQASQQLRLEIVRPEVRLAFWTHFCTLSPATMLILLWGVPFFAEAQNQPMPLVSALLSSFVFTGILCGFWYAHVCANSPARRSMVVTLMASLMMLLFAIVFVVPTQLPLWYLILISLVVGGAGPSAMIAFDFSKEFVTKARLGATNGFINMGGFLATFVMMFLVGVILDLVHFVALGSNPETPLYTVTGFRFALLAVVFVLGFGLFRFSANLKKVKALQI